MPSDESQPPDTQVESPTGPEPVATAASAATVRRSLSPRDTTLRIGSDAAPRPAGSGAPDRYGELAEVARGGMAAIRSAFDRVIRRRVAIKQHDAREDPDGLGHFVEEAQITGQLDHPNIVPVYDLLTDERGVPDRFTMKLVDGETLADRIDALPEGDLPTEALEALLQVFLRVCDAVAFAHERGVIHRDLKPSNIMVGAHGQVYVMDWGVALLSDRRRPSEELKTRTTLPMDAARTGPLSGTPAFMAPEQALGRTDEIDERTDVYGLGTILYAVLTGAAPHGGEEPGESLARARAGELLRPQERCPERTLPPGLCRITLRALAPLKQDRYASVEALRADVEAFLRGGGWFETRPVARGETILREGEAADAAYIIAEGHCQLYRGAGDERRFMRMLGPGDVFGETAIFGSTTRTASVVASSDARLVRVTREALERELGRTEWLKTFVEALAERFLELEERLRRIEDGR